ncbi:surface layer (S-layer) glycoprotein [Bacillus sp. NRRL B-14911]|uniref:SLH domain-containing protein n=1 Tax=Bacillus infantis NRRL B-14911 TaxID=1367477 RepID=U5LIJ3_9BACI|nr:MULTISPECIES: S-layer homology domain-containing protein [Bacillus]AGX06511.1 hypothetical protein N288_23360 [Bacillus infantis NRRL B-14911]EAR68558.1 surface layer (S-layer) glycoprotein [Bacillus sp. NRRL B-14911]
MAYQPKSYRKFIATAATATIVASAVAPAASAASVSDFKDVAAKYQEAVSYLVANGITQGTTDTTFGTHDNVKRGDAAIWLAKALKLDLTNVPASGFTDTGRYDAAVSALKSEGVLSGKTATTFEPNALLTRGEMAKILANAYDLKSDAAVPFTDLGPNFGPYIKALYEFEVTQGKTATTFGTSMNITRGDLAIFLKRAAEVVKEPVVTSVTPLNALEVEVKFNTAVNKTDAETVARYSINGTSPTKATLSEDGKTVTLRYASANLVEVKDGVVVVDAVKTAANADVKTKKFTSVYSYEDTVRPTLTTVTYDNYYTAKVWFSEPIQSAGNVQISDANATYSHTPGDKFITVNLSNANVAMDKNITVTVVGATDYSGNLVSPNPVVANVQKVKTDSVKPTVSSVDVQDTTRFSVKFSEALAANPTITVNGTDVTSIAGTTVTVDSKDSTKYNVVLGSAQTGVKTVAVAAGYKDISGNEGAAFSQLVEFKADTTAPTYVSHEVKTISNKQYLVVTFNEEVTPVAAKAVYGTYVDANSVTREVSNLGTVSSHDVNNDGKYEAVKVELTGNNPGSYTVTLPSGLVEDLAGNDSVAKSATFTLGSASDSDKPSVSAYSVNADKVTVTFNEPVTAATALNLANYKVEGETVFTSAIFKGNQQTVELTLREGSILIDGTRTVSVSGVRDVNGNAMDTYTALTPFKENVKPTISAAKLTAANTVTVTFSEAMKEANLEDATVDFKVKVDGVDRTVTNWDYTAGDKTLAITFSNVVTDLSKPVVLEVLSGNNVVDANGNSLATTGTVTVTK